MPKTMDLFDLYSIEATPKDAAALTSLHADVPKPHEVFVPYLPEEQDETRIAACVTLRDSGFEPVPHLSARRIGSVEDLDRLLGALRHRAGVTRVFLIAGDVAQPVGPFADTLSLIETGLLEGHGIRRVGIAGHPDGHPDVAEAILWNAMCDKVAALAARGLDPQIVTQFSFDAQQVLCWLRAVRERGIDAPVRIGVPGPAGVRTLFRYATRCGVTASASAVAKYGLSLGRLLGSAAPDKFLAELKAGFDPNRTGDVRLHLFPFGGFAQTADWMLRTIDGSSASDVAA